ncbi:hypothetical protein F4778DRAFT_777795 [Xylariomycetidae sp. FL2044]|nr:hypothetical protein F4778DRAFT_777795 [Xylariomycetidae sp. FL2044]
MDTLWVLSSARSRLFPISAIPFTKHLSSLFASSERLEAVSQTLIYVEQNVLGATDEDLIPLSSRQRLLDVVNVTRTETICLQQRLEAGRGIRGTRAPVKWAMYEHKGAHKGLDSLAQGEVTLSDILQLLTCDGIRDAASLVVLAPDWFAALRLLVSKHSASVHEVYRGMSMSTLPLPHWSPNKEDDMTHEYLKLLRGEQYANFAARAPVGWPTVLSIALRSRYYGLDALRMLIEVIGVDPRFMMFVASHLRGSFI